MRSCERPTPPGQSAGRTLTSGLRANSPTAATAVAAAPHAVGRRRGARSLRPEFAPHAPVPKGWTVTGGRARRYGDALAWVEAPSEAAAVRRSLDLYRLSDWTDDARQLVVFPQDAYPEDSGPHDYTRAVLTAGPPSQARPGARLRAPLALACLAGLRLRPGSPRHGLSGHVARPHRRPRAPVRAVRQETGLSVSSVGCGRHRARTRSGFRVVFGSHRLVKRDWSLNGVKPYVGRDSRERHRYFRGHNLDCGAGLDVAGRTSPGVEP